jgi:lactobin A/cerein 7B family class IIb bacteriocin
MFNNNYLEVNIMASIIVNNLLSYSVSGAELFNDSESFMQELTEDELMETNGGISPSITVTIPLTAIATAATIGAALSAAISYYTGRGR